MTRVSNHSGSLERIYRGRDRALACVLWPLAAMMMANLVFQSYFAARDPLDFRALYGGAQRFIEGVSVYAEPSFMLTPSGLLAVVPFGLMPAGPAFIVWNTVSVVSALVGVALSVRFVGARLFGPLTAAVVLGFALSESLTLTLLYSNTCNTLLLALGAGFLLAESREKPAAAGVLLGLGLALKPVFMLVLLVPLVRRCWSMLAWAIAVPAILNISGLLLVSHPGDFFTVAVPNLLHARPGANSSLWAVAHFYGAPELLITAVRIGLLALAVAAIWRLRDLADPVVRAGTSYAVALTAIFLTASLTQTYYSMTLLPALLVVAARGDSPLRNPLAWLAVYGFSGLDGWIWPAQPGVTEFVALVRPVVAWALLFFVMVYWAFRRHTPAAADETPAAVR